MARGGGSGLSAVDSVFAPPSEVFREFSQMVTTGELWDAAQITMQALFLGYALAVLVGVADFGCRGLGVSGVDLLEVEVAAHGVGHAALHDQKAGMSEGQRGGQEAIEPGLLLGGRRQEQPGDRRPQ